jgi:hypothetical protein
MDENFKQLRRLAFACRALKRRSKSSMLGLKEKTHKIGRNVENYQEDC